MVTFSTTLTFIFAQKSFPVTCPTRLPHLPYILTQVLECMKEKACETSIDVYNHNSPAYQVSRGDCICYTGDIVCQRPREGECLVHGDVGLADHRVVLGVTHTYPVPCWVGQD